jgi:membrane-associated protease RseP (regulator of RpoE activity)
MAWRRINTNRITLSCTLTAVMAIGVADWAWGQGGGGGVGASGAAAAASSASDTGQGSAAAAGQSPHGTVAQRRNTATGSITTEAIMQSRPNSMDQRTGYVGLAPQSPRGRALLGIDLDMRYPATAIVTKVYPGSGADEAGLRAGDVIVGIDNIPVTSAEDVIRVIADADPSQAVSVGYMRRGVTTVHLRPRDPAAADSLSQHGLPPVTPRPGSTATQIAKPSYPQRAPQTQTGAFGDRLPTDPLNREIEDQLRQLNEPPEKP